jgi:chitinase
VSKKFNPILIFAALLLNWMCSRSSPPPPPPPAEPPNLTKVVLGYYPSWKKNVFDHTRIKYEYLTHIAHAFTKPDAAGNLIVSADYVYPELVSEAHRWDVKVIMSIGGWGNCAGFPGMAAAPETRNRFVHQVLDFVKTHHYDGVDIDWEFVSNPVEQRDFVFFIKELSAVLKAQNPPLLLTMAGPSEDYWGKWINYEELVSSFDFIGCMTYDYHGEWTDHSGHNSPLYSCGNDACGSFNDSYLYCISRGIPGEKLLLGLPFYGRSFDCADLYQKFQTSLDYDYNEVMPLLSSGWTYLWDDCAQVPYIQKPDKSMIVSFDDERSIGLKCNYVKQKNAAGVIIWEITQDDYNGSSVLLKVVGESFKKTQQ